MQFRWVAFIALWTTFMGPILGAPSGRAPDVKARSSSVAKNVSQPSVPNHHP